MAKFIGVSGIAGSGKDLFCEKVKNFYDKNKNLNRNVFILSLANKLKNDVRKSCLDIYGIDSVNATREEKNKIRDLLVFYGDVMRQNSKGTYWYKHLDKEVAKREKAGEINQNDLVLISDIRYAEFKKDEVSWVKSKESGVLVHIKKYSEFDIPLKPGYHLNKHYASPPNKKERENDPKVQEAADYLVDWPEFKTEKDSGTEEYVKNFCDWYEEHIQ